MWHRAPVFLRLLLFFFGGMSSACLLIDTATLSQYIDLEDVSPVQRVKNKASATPKVQPMQSALADD